ncbi:MAG: phytoene desaturase family protein [Phycisphaerae bacterium]
MDYDVIIIGAGMSGLAAGIRLAHFDRRVCIVERHNVCGGLNSYYRRAGRDFDVGLHAVTNYVPPGVRSTPLPKLLRQLRLTRDDFDLREQRGSEIRFPSVTLRFSNNIDRLVADVADHFPDEIDRFRRLIAAIRDYDDIRLDAPTGSARRWLRDHLRDPLLIDMILCPLMYYGSAQEHDMDRTQFVTMFKSIFLEGFARPRQGVRRIIAALVKRYRACGGVFKMRCGVNRINVSGTRVTSLTLDNGDTIAAPTVLSSAGYVETMRLCTDAVPAPTTADVGRVSFVESILVLDAPPRRLGHDATIEFYNDTDTFHYETPDDLVDPRSGVICCPNNYQDHDDMPEGLFRVTWLASPRRWAALTPDAYQAAKCRCLDDVLRLADRRVPGLARRVVFTDMFTPRTIQRFTGHINGAVYGTPGKLRDGRTRLHNLFLCGTDQGFVGIVGALLSGISMANLHVLSDA